VNRYYYYVSWTAPAWILLCISLWGFFLLVIEPWNSSVSWKNPIKLAAITTIRHIQNSIGRTAAEVFRFVWAFTEEIW